jgi:hypothetical protein
VLQASLVRLPALSVAGVFAAKADLAGQEVLVRDRLVTTGSRREAFG